MIVDEILKKKIASVATEHKLSCVVLFGSQASGKTHRYSDTDVAFMSERDIDYVEQLKIQNDIGTAFGVNNVEFVNMRRVSPLLMKQIGDKGKLLYEDRRGRFIDFKVLSFKLYVETAPLRRLRDRYLNNFIQAHAY